MVAARRVLVLAPMPLELDAVVDAFGLQPVAEGAGGVQTGRVGGSAVAAVHIGMGPPAARAATTRLLDEAERDGAPFGHVMVAGICGGLDPDLPVGTLLNPETVIDHATGASFRHSPPGGTPTTGGLITTEGVSLDPDLSRRFLEDGCLGVDMETSAVAGVCASRGMAWSVYRCISDRAFDGLLDERILTLTRPDGSVRIDEVVALLDQEPDLAPILERLGRNTASAARLAAGAALQGCRALDD